MIKIRSAILVPLVALAFGAAVFAGCGGGDENSASQVDIDQLTVLAGQINDISVNKDAEGFCAILSPSEIESTFISRARCTREYTKIFASVKEPGEATLKDISVDGDTAQVTFEEQDGAVTFVKEDGKWWLSVDQGADSGSSSGTTTDSTEAG